MADSIALVAALHGLLSLSLAILEPLQRDQISAASLDKSMKQLQVELSALTEVLQGLEPLCRVTSEKTSVISIDLFSSCNETLLEADDLISGYTRKSKFQRMSWRMVYGQRLDRLKADLDRHKATFSIILTGHLR